jgi:hypothetical protein
MYGLTIRSDFGLTGWPGGRAGPADIEIRRSVLDGPEVTGPAHSARWLAIDGALAVAVQGVGRYRAKNGTLIEVDPDPAAPSYDLELYISGALMGALLHQRGLFPLHASSVVLDGKAVGFSGASGAGKSTLVAALAERGAPLVTDDASVLDLSGRGALVWPGPRRLKLDDQSMTVLSRGPAERVPAGSNTGKFQVPVTGSAGPAEPVPLARVYLLADGEGGTQPRVQPLATMDAISAFVDQTHFLAFASELGLGQQVFRLAATAASRVEVYRLVRPRGLEHLPATIELIESHARPT